MVVSISNFARKVRLRRLPTTYLTLVILAIVVVFFIFAFPIDKTVPGIRPDPTANWRYPTSSVLVVFDDATSQKGTARLGKQICEILEASRIRLVLINFIL